jgi:hypothetical protein
VPPRAAARVVADGQGDGAGERQGAVPRRRGSTVTAGVTISPAATFDGWTTKQAAGGGGSDREAGAGVAGQAGGAGGGVAGADLSGDRSAKPAAPATAAWVAVPDSVLLPGLLAMATVMSPLYGWRVSEDVVGLDPHRQRQRHARRCRRPADEHQVIITAATMSKSTLVADTRPAVDYQGVTGGSAIEGEVAKAHLTRRWPPWSGCRSALALPPLGSAPSAMVTMPLEADVEVAPLGSALEPRPGWWAPGRRRRCRRRAGP